jgi:hypothetical protein
VELDDEDWEDLDAVVNEMRSREQTEGEAERMRQQAMRR